MNDRSPENFCHPGNRNPVFERMLSCDQRTMNTPLVPLKVYECFRGCTLAVFDHDKLQDGFGGEMIDRPLKLFVVLSDILGGLFLVIL